MGFLTELLADFLASLTTHGATSIKKRLPHLLIGFFSIALATGLLLVYFFVLVPVPKESYYVATIKYSKCYAVGPKEDRSIVLEAGDKKYYIGYSLWRTNFSEKQVINALNAASQATVWLVSADANIVKGISAPDFDIKPSVGYARDEADRGILLWMAAFFGGMGILVISVALFSKSYEND